MLDQTEEGRKKSRIWDNRNYFPNDPLKRKMKRLAVQMKQEEFEVDAFGGQPYKLLLRLTSSLPPVLEQLCERYLDNKARRVLENEIKNLENLEALKENICCWNINEQQLREEFVIKVNRLSEIYKHRFDMVNRACLDSRLILYVSWTCVEDCVKEDCAEEKLLKRELNCMIKDSVNTQIKYLALLLKELDKMLCETQFETSASKTKEQLTILMNVLCTQLEQLSVSCFNRQETRALQNETKKLEDLSKIACNWYKCEHQSGIEFLRLMIELLDIHRYKFGIILRDKIKGKNHSDRDHQWDFQSVNSQEEILIRKLKGMIQASNSLLPLSYSSGQAMKEPGVSIDHVVDIFDNSKTLAHEGSTSKLPGLHVTLGLAFSAMLLALLCAMGNPLDNLSKSTSTTEGTQPSILSLREAFSRLLPIITWTAMFIGIFIGTALHVRSMPFKEPLVLLLPLSLLYYLTVFASTGSGFIIQCGSIKMPSLLFASGGAMSFVLFIGFVLWVLHSKLGKTVESQPRL